MPRRRVEGVVIVVGDRLVGSIAAGHDQRGAVELAQEQVVQGRVRQHHAEERVAGGNLAGQAGAGFSAQEDDGPAGRGEQLLPRRELTSQSSSAAARSATMTANGFSSRCLRLRNTPTAALVAARTGEVVAAQAFDGRDRSVEQLPRRDGNRVVAGNRAVHRGRGMSSCGPQAGQAVGWAWKRRLRGSSYSARQQGAHGETRPCSCARGRRERR